MEAKPSLLARGKSLMERFCEANGLPVPRVVEADPARWNVGVCAYYRSGAITVSVRHCAAIGVAAMAWSFPGHSVDRTPYGVIQHELGHHVDLLNAKTRTGRYWSDFSIRMREQVGEQPLTSYCPDDAEWFAEMFRLFVTNPNLLEQLRPRTHAALVVRFKPVFEDGWRERLAGAPDRTIASIEKKLQPPVRRRAAAPAPREQASQHPLL